MISDSDRERLFINDCGRCGVFDCYPGAIENDDLSFTGASGFFAGNNFRELCVNIFFLHQTCRDCVVRVADRANLFKTVCDNFRRRQHSGIDFVLVRIVRTDSGDKSSGSNVFLCERKILSRAYRSQRHRWFG